MLPNRSGSSLCWLSQVQGSSSFVYGTKGTSYGRGRNKAPFPLAPSDTTNVVACPKFAGKRRTPSSYDRIISWLPFFSRAPQAAFERLALVTSNQAICLLLGDSRVYVLMWGDAAVRPNRSLFQRWKKESSHRCLSAVTMLYGIEAPAG